jgi:hypothetical protein
VIDAGDLDHEWLLFAATIPERSRKDTRERVLVGFAETYHNAGAGYVAQTGAVHSPWLIAYSPAEIQFGRMPASWRVCPSA